MARPLVSDELWELIEPPIPRVKRRHRYPGRKRLHDRKVLTGILFVLRTGSPGSTCRGLGGSERTCGIAVSVVVAGGRPTRRHRYGCRIRPVPLVVGVDES
jgi:transposase